MRATVMTSVPIWLGAQAEGLGPKARGAVSMRDV